MNKKWEKIMDPENWPELKAAHWSNNMSDPWVFDAKIKHGEEVFRVCWDKFYSEFFVFRQSFNSGGLRAANMEGFKYNKRIGGQYDY